MASLAPGGVSEVWLSRRDAARSARSVAFVALTLAGLAVVLALAIGIIGFIVVKGLPALSWPFLTSPPTEGMSEGGIGPMLRGSILLMAGTMVLVLPVGVLGGVWLAEYAGSGKVAGLLRGGVTTLAGTPSIIFGLFGLAIFVLKMDLGTSLAAGWFTLALYALPVVALTTEQAIRSLPKSFEDAALSLGLSKAQSLRRVILPAARSGIVTGVVLAAGRAAGEAPPILLTAGIYYSTEKLTLGWATLSRPVANLPYHLAEGYRQGGVIPEKIVWGTCLTLMLLMLAINGAAFWIRSRSATQPRW